MRLEYAAKSVCLRRLGHLCGGKGATTQTKLMIVNDEWRCVLPACLQEEEEYRQPFENEEGKEDAKVKSRAGKRMK